MGTRARAAAELRLRQRERVGGWREVSTKVKGINAERVRRHNARLDSFVDEMVENFKGHLDLVDETIRQFDKEEATAAARRAAADTYDHELRAFMKQRYKDEDFGRPQPSKPFDEGNFVGQGRRPPARVHSEHHASTSSAPRPAPERRRSTSQYESSTSHGNGKGVPPTMDRQFWKDAYKREGEKQKNTRKAEQEEMESKFQAMREEIQSRRREEDAKRKKAAERARQQFDEKREHEERKRAQDRAEHRKEEDERFYRKLEEEYQRAKAQQGGSGGQQWDSKTEAFLGGIWRTHRIEAQDKAYKEWEAKWEQFAQRAKAEGACIHYDDVPWVPGHFKVSWSGEGDSNETKKKRTHLAMLRWHPDKFLAAFGAALAESDRERILEEVTQTAARLFKER